MGLTTKLNKEVLDSIDTLLKPLLGQQASYIKQKLNCNKAIAWASHSANKSYSYQYLTGYEKAYMEVRDEMDRYIKKLNN